MILVGHFELRIFCNSTQKAQGLAPPLEKNSMLLSLPTSFPGINHPPALNNRLHGREPHSAHAYQAAEAACPLLGDAASILTRTCHPPAGSAPTAQGWGWEERAGGRDHLAASLEWQSSR